MITRVIAWYARRIVNVNINIILAGVLALIPMLGVVHLAEYLLATHQLKNGVLQEKLEAHHKLLITGVTFLADVTFDVMIYFALHWIAHHAPRRVARHMEHRIEGVADAAAEHVPFFKDAAKVQFQRAVLSPLLYLIFLGTQFTLMSAMDTPPAWATVIGLALAMTVVRSIHTFWMLKEERTEREIAAGRVCGKCGHDLRGIPADVSGTCPECGKEFQRPVVVTPLPGPAEPREAGGGKGAPGVDSEKVRNGAAQSLKEKGVKSVSRS